MPRAASAQATVFYKCTNAKGEVSMQNGTPCAPGMKQEVKRIGEELINTGSSTKPIIGVSLDQSYQGDGARVQEVTPGGPSEAAGLEAGDIIVEFDGQPVTDATALIVDIRSKQPGDEVSLTVQRDGSTQDLTLTLGSDSSSG